MATLPDVPGLRMILRYFRREEARRRLVATLHARVGDAARAPALFHRLGVPDTVEGRFETLCLHMYLVLRRLRRLPSPADDVGQDLVNSLFSELDVSLRELGVGDVGVPKRMKKLASAFYGRVAQYDAPLDAGDAAGLAWALARNVLGLEDPGAAAGLARYVIAAGHALEGVGLDEMLAQGPPFPAPEAFGGKAETA